MGNDSLLLIADVEACRRLPLPVALAPMPDFRASVSPVNHGILDLPIPPFVNPLIIRCLPTLMGAFGFLFCNDFKRLFYFFFHTAVCFAPVHHDEKEKKQNSFEIVAK